MDQHTTAIRCRGCEKQWRLSIELTGNEVEAFAGICECGAIIVGNYAPHVESGTGNNPEQVFQKKYLTNGHFDVLQLQEEEIENLPEFDLE